MSQNCAQTHWRATKTYCGGMEVHENLIRQHEITPHQVVISVLPIDAAMQSGNAQLVQRCGLKQRKGAVKIVPEVRTYSWDHWGEGSAGAGSSCVPESPWQPGRAAWGIVPPI